MPKVLIIEDNDVVLNLVRTGLRNDPAWELLFATDGERGLSLAYQHLPDLSAIILDVFLPRLDGRAVLARLRDADPELPIIAVSADDHALDEMRNGGATITLPKPIRSDHVADVLHALIPHNATASTQPERTSDTPPYDRQVVPQMHVLDLDIEHIQRHIRTAIERRRYDGPQDWQEFLLINGAAVQDGDTIRPTVAGALTFAPHPERYLITHGVDVAEFRGLRSHSTDVRLQQPIRGNMFAVIERTVDLLWARIDHSTTVNARHGVAQQQHDAYPYIVLRELTVNALCHRDWSIEGSIVRIQVFPDRIEWISPGGLPSDMQIAELRDRQVSRNPTLAQLLYQAGIIERFGMGLDTVFDTLETHGHPPPEMIDLGHSFIVRVFARPNTLETRPASIPETLQDELSQRQRQLLTVIEQREEVRASVLAEAIGETKATVIRELNRLIAMELICAVGAGRATRYRRRGN